MIRVEVSSVEVKERPVSFLAKDGKKKEFLAREQVVYAYVVGASGQPSAYPEKALVNLDEKQEPYPVGWYSLAPQSVQLNRFCKMELRAIRLVPLKSAVQPVPKSA